MLTILLIDDHELFRAGIKLLLTELADEVSFVEASSCAAALALHNASEFSVVLLDMNLPGASGLEALTLIRERFEASAIVVLSGEDDPALIRAVIEAGAAGFIPKSSSQRVMMAALQLVLAGGTYLPPHVLSSSPHGSYGARPGSHDHEASSTSSRGLHGQMTDRQLETLRQAMQGKANKVIARDMLISEATVKSHLSTAFRVLGVKNRTEAVFAAARAGLSV